MHMLVQAALWLQRSQDQFSHTQKCHDPAAYRLVDDVVLVLLVVVLLGVVLLKVQQPTVMRPVSHSVGPVR